MEIIERIQLLRQLEEHRFAVWSDDGRDIFSLKPSASDCIFSLYNNEEAEYIRKHLGDTFIPTENLKEFIAHGYMDNNEYWNIRMLIVSEITLVIALATMLIAIIKI